MIAHTRVVSTTPPCYRSVASCHTCWNRLFLTRGKLLCRFRDWGYSPLFVSVVTGEGVATLRSLLTGQARIDWGTHYTALWECRATESWAGAQSHSTEHGRFRTPSAALCACRAQWGGEELTHQSPAIGYNREYYRRRGWE